MKHPLRQIEGRTIKRVRYTDHGDEHYATLELFFTDKSMVTVRMECGHTVHAQFFRDEKDGSDEKEVKPGRKP